MTTLVLINYWMEWAIRLVMLVLIPMRRSPATAKGWLLLIFFLPWAGLVLFLLIGRSGLPAWRLTRQRESQNRLARIGKQMRSNIHFQEPQLGGNLAQAVTLALNLGDMPMLGGNSAELLADYDATINRLVEDIDAAQHHVHLLFYIYATDATGQKVTAALARAVERGVVCRVLMDAVGTGRDCRVLLPQLRELGIEAFPMLPVGLFRTKAARFDLRNHRKIAIIDGQIGYIGSQNIVDSTFKPGLTFVELMVRVRGPIVLELQAVFQGDWYQESDILLEDKSVFPDPTIVGPVTMQVLPSGPGYQHENNQRMFLSLVHGARRRVVITTPYFVPDEALLAALQTAVLRGAEVHLVVNKFRDQLLVSLAQQSYYQQLLESGVQIHRHTRGFLHAKHLSIDNSVSLIGSSNMDIRSFQLNNEISILIYDVHLTNQLAEEQQRNFNNSELLTREEWQRRSWLVRFAENLARLMSPLL